MVYDVLKTNEEMFGVKRKAQYQHDCDACGEAIPRGEFYDYATGWTATSKNEYGESYRSRWTFKTHLYHCGVPLKCQMGLHNFVFREQKGIKDNDDIFAIIFNDYQEEGYFCTDCNQKADDTCNFFEL